MLKRLPYSLKLAISVVLLAKLLVFAVGYATVFINEGPASPLTIIMNEFNRWDAPHYLDIARNWYVNTGDQANFIVFFPLYPILIRITTFNTSYIALSALAVSNLCSIIAFIYLWKLVKLDFGNDIALKAIAFLAIFPTAYFLSAPYTEGLFFALVISSLYYGRLAKWSIAGNLGLLAALTRIAGLLMLPTLLVEYLYQKGWRLRKTSLRQIDPKAIWTGLPVIGFLIYLGINAQVTGNAFAFVKVEAEHWYNTFNPVLGFSQAVNWATAKQFPDFLTIGFLPIVFAIFGLVMVIVAIAYKVRPSYFVYMLTTWMLAVSTSWWISVPRYVMAMFPMFIIFALLAKRRLLTIISAFCSSAFMCFLAVLFVLHLWAF